MIAIAPSAPDTIMKNGLDFESGAADQSQLWREARL